MFNSSFDIKKNSFHHLVLLASLLLNQVTTANSASTPHNPSCQVGAQGTDDCSAYETSATEAPAIVPVVVAQPELNQKCNEGSYKDQNEAFGPFAQFAQSQCANMSDDDTRKCIARIAKLAGMAAGTANAYPYKVSTSAGIPVYNCSSSNNCVSEFKTLNDKIDHQSNFGILGMSPDRFALHPKDSTQALAKIACSAQDSPSFEDLSDLKGAAYFRSARSKITGIGKCMKNISEEDFKKNCGVPSSANGTEIYKYFKDSWSLEENDIHSWAQSVRDNNPSNARRVNMLLGSLLSFCPTLNIALAYNELQNSKWDETPGATPAGSRSIAYFDAQSQAANPLCVKELSNISKNATASPQAAIAQPAVPLESTEPATQSTELEAPPPAGSASPPTAEKASWSSKVEAEFIESNDSQKNFRIEQFAQKVNSSISLSNDFIEVDDQIAKVEAMIQLAIDNQELSKNRSEQASLTASIIQLRAQLRLLKEHKSTLESD